MSWLELWAILQFIGNCAEIVFVICIGIFAITVGISETRFQSTKDKARREQYRLDDMMISRDNAKLDK